MKVVEVELEAIQIFLPKLSNCGAQRGIFYSCFFA